LEVREVTFAKHLNKEPKVDEQLVIGLWYKIPINRESNLKVLDARFIIWLDSELHMWWMSIILLDMQSWLGSTSKFVV
jgi:hypothetical protein